MASPKASTEAPRRKLEPERFVFPEPWAAIWAARKPLDIPPHVIATWLDNGAILGSDWGSSSRFLIGLGECRAKATPSPVQAKPSFYSPDFFVSEERPWLEFETDLWLTRDELLRSLRPFVKPEGYASVTWLPPERQDFATAFAELQSRFRDGTLTKAVPVVFERARLRPERLHRAHWLVRALEYSIELPVAVYGAWNARSGLLGATPEKLFEYDGSGRVLTMALAGTRRDSDRDNLGHLLDDPKEVREHGLVVTGISEALSRAGELQVGQTEELRLPGLSHLRTPIAVRPEPRLEFAEMARALHPTPALGAYPREAGWEWLRLQDREAPTRRGRFGAPFGARADGYGQCVVAIRGIQWGQGEADDELLIGAGCGVIAESQLEREWRELQGKIHAVKGIFGFL